MRLGEYGVTLTITTSFNLTGATAAKLKYVDPAGVAGTIVLSLPPFQVNPGIFKHVTTSAQFQQLGTWLIALEVDFGANQRMKSAPVGLYIGESL